MPAKLESNHFFNRCRVAHHDKYDYSKAIFLNLRTKIIIICPIHGDFHQKALSHLQGHGCQKCVFDYNVMSFDEFTKRAIEIHGARYEYIGYKLNSTIIMQIKCDIHGIFEQNKFNHLIGRGCKLCAVKNDHLSTKEFIHISNSVHSNKYDYSECIYIKNDINVKIICQIHGPFMQLPLHHMRGSGCSSCSHSISKLENLWLDSLGIEKQFRQVRFKFNNQLFKVDALKNGIVYEFYGDFWHGNPRLYEEKDINYISGISFGELYSKTQQRENLIKSAGYNIISIWESDFGNANI